MGGGSYRTRVMSDAQIRSGFECDELHDRSETVDGNPLQWLACSGLNGPNIVVPRADYQNIVKMRFDSMTNLDDDL